MTHREGRYGRPRWALDALLALSDRALALPLLLVIVLLGIAGVVTQEAGSVGIGPAGLFDLNHELNPPSAFSAALLAVAGALAFVRGGRVRHTARVERLATFALSAFLFLMAVDELAQIHERLEALANVDWQTLYAPLLLAGAGAWYALVRALPGQRRARALLAAGAGAWAVAQGLEALQWSGDELTEWMIVPEEMLEMVGSTLFIAAFLTLLRPAAPARAHATRTGA